MATYHGGAPGLLMQHGRAAIRCAGKPLVIKFAKVVCVITGAVSSVGAGITLNWKDPRELGCNRKDIKEFDTEMEMEVTLSVVSVSKNNVGFGFGIGGLKKNFLWQVGYQKCTITPI